jgi:hypothetical protein
MQVFRLKAEGNRLSRKDGSASVVGWGRPGSEVSL